MVCIHCGGKTQVFNSRAQKRFNQVWRRRRCLNCGSNFTTNESVDYGSTWAVKSPSGALEPFQRDKLLLSLYSSCQHRKNGLQEASALASTVINKLAGQVESGTVSKSSIIRAAQVTLNRFDKAASVHYASYHK